jgi:hypothetical protein
MKQEQNVYDLVWFTWRIKEEKKRSKENQEIGKMMENNQ